MPCAPGRCTLLDSHRRIRRIEDDKKHWRMYAEMECVNCKATVSVPVDVTPRPILPGDFDAEGIHNTKGTGDT